ncbi:hypothetical protein BGZ60DRAFT_514373 [Tricladium varicosporioides]|nr:hypothetical protein BGZ60DRAFT_514373 [Hymenoscyphus varicosporioides]
MAPIKESLFLGCLWSSMAVSSIFICCRFGIRIKVFGRLWFDDLFLFVAWLMIIASTILWQNSYRVLFLLSRWVDEELMPVSEAELEYSRHVILGIEIMYNFSITAVKMSFLLFFRRLLYKVDIKWLSIWWWVVCFITLGALVTSIGDGQYKCLVGSIEQIQASCPETASQNHALPAVIANTVLDLLTDLLSEYHQPGKPDAYALNSSYNDTTSVTVES